jgi:hypothetical protein
VRETTGLIKPGERRETRRNASVEGQHRGQTHGLSIWQGASWDLGRNWQMSPALVILEMLIIEIMNKTKMIKEHTL